jgi:glycosyltransferase involved in cell wall biosynthesis
MKKLTIINKGQYGYHTDAYKYTKYLQGYDLTYICFDVGKKKFNPDNTDIVYVPWKGHKLTDGWNFFKKIHQVIKTSNPDDIVLIKNYELCFLVTFFDRLPHYILDIRTLAVCNSGFKRIYLNILTKINTFFFKNISVISEGLARQLHLINYHILPLGADMISQTNKVFNIPRVLYVGTFDGRKISRAVKGYCIFLKNHKEFAEKSALHLVGDGKPDVVAKIKETIHQYDKFANVTYHGYKTHEEIKHLFDTCNIGLSFIPLEKYYDDQPATKTFEYLLSGLACIATRTSENQKVIDQSNGVLCEDTPKSVAQALEFVVTHSDQYHSETIRASVRDFTWKHIVHEDLEKGILANLS